MRVCKDGAYQYTTIYRQQCLPRDGYRDAGQTVVSEKGHSRDRYFV